MDVRITKEKVMKKQKRESLAQTLFESTTPGHPNFDPAFNREIRELRPDWFSEDSVKLLKLQEAVLIHIKEFKTIIENMKGESHE